MNSKLKGRLAEKIALEFLLNQGYQIIDKNWHFKNLGEIDIIAKKKNFVNFVEVKSLWQKSFFTPEDHFHQKKLQKLIKLANFYSNRNNFDYWIISLLAISFLQKGVKINYYENLTS